MFSRSIISLLVIFCFSPALSEVPHYDLIENGAVVAKLQGHVTFMIGGIENKTVTISVPAQKDVTVSGQTTASKTVFILSWNQSHLHDQLLADNNNSFILWITFTKKSIGSVTLTESKLQYTVNDNASSEGTVKNVTWSVDKVLVDQSNMAYECSMLKATNQNGEVMKIDQALLQPFDLKNHDFGSKSICAEDRTTTSAPITTPAPKPKPIGNWTVNQENRYTCIRLIANLKLDIAYTKQDRSNTSAIVQVPMGAKVSPPSTCNYNFNTERVEGTEQILHLDFKINENPWSLTFNFANDSVLSPGSSIAVYYVKLEYTVDEKTFPNASSIGEKKIIENVVNKTGGQGALSLFKSDAAHFYRCNSEEKNVVAPGFTILSRDLRIEAFLPNRTTFMTEKVCLTDQQNETSDLVPIITGAALAALVVFVLIAYLVGRARARANTYETI